MTDIPKQSKQIQTNITSAGKLEVTLAEVPVPELGDNDVLIKVEATPINPSDLGLLFGPADMSTATQEGTADSPKVVADIPEKMMRMVQARIDQALPVGNEGGGVVVAAGSAPDAQALIGKTVGAVGGAMYSEYRVVPAQLCLVMNEGTTSEEAASCFVNPLTALGMVETMRMEGHTALVHTAAASNLGQMLVKICLADGIELVNIVRKQDQVDLLKSLGAKYVLNSSDDNFMSDLTDALAETKATIAFDATGGGTLGSQILSCMEAAAQRNMGAYSRYGSDTFKQLYIYGGLDTTPTTLTRNFGFSWAIGGWLLTPFMQKVGNEVMDRLRKRVADEIKTTFASTYSDRVSLAGALDLDAIAVYNQRATGKKTLICPHQ